MACPANEAMRRAWDGPEGAQWSELADGFDRASREHRTVLLRAAALAYLVMPLDIIPDVIPGLGQLDDIGIILLGIRAFIALCPPELVQWYRGELGFDPRTREDQSDTIEGSYRVVDD